MNRFLVSAALVVAAVAFAGGASAQRAQVGLTGGFGSYTGDDFDGLDAGYTVGGDLLFGVSRGLQVGGAVDFSSYGLEGLTQENEQLDVLAVGRWVFDLDRARPFVGAMSGYSRRWMEVEDAEGTSNGFVAGPTAGILVPMRRVDLVVGANALYHWYDDTTIGDVINRETDGLRFLGRAGISIPVGR